jgi:hypothetical protein
VDNQQGPLTGWNKHKAAFNVQDGDGDPRELFTVNLLAELKEWQSQGDQLVVLIDANEEVQIREFARHLKAFGLCEAHTDQHPNSPWLAPARMLVSVELPSTCQLNLEVRRTDHNLLLQFGSPSKL